MAGVRIGRRSQVVRQWTANPPRVGSTPTGASKNKSRTAEGLKSRRQAERPNNRLQPKGRTTDCSLKAEKEHGQQTGDATWCPLFAFRVKAYRRWRTLLFRFWLSRHRLCLPHSLACRLDKVAAAKGASQAHSEWHSASFLPHPSIDDQYHRERCRLLAFITDKRSFALICCSTAAATWQRTFESMIAGVGVLLRSSSVAT